MWCKNSSIIGKTTILIVLRMKETTSEEGKIIDNFNQMSLNSQNTIYKHSLLFSLLSPLHHFITHYSLSLSILQLFFVLTKKKQSFCYNFFFIKCIRCQ